MVTGATRNWGRVFSGRGLLAVGLLGLAGWIGWDTFSDDAPDAPPTLTTNRPAMATATSSPFRNGASSSTALASTQKAHHQPTPTTGAAQPKQAADAKPEADVSQQAATLKRLTPLEPRAEPYALMANTGTVKVRFSVRTTGDADAHAVIALRQSGEQGSIAMNDNGKDGDLVAGDGTFGTNLLIDTAEVKPDTCLLFDVIAQQKHGSNKSMPMELCVSSFPIGIASVNTTRPAKWGDSTFAAPDEVLITVSPGSNADLIRKLASSINAEVVGSLLPLRFYQLRLPEPTSPEQLLTMVMELRKSPGVTSASVNLLGQGALNVNDQAFDLQPADVNSQHGLKMVLGHTPTADANAANAWDGNNRGAGVKVVVMDTGLDLTHPDLPDTWTCQLIPAPPAPVTNPTVLETPCTASVVGSTVARHGTLVAGVIAASTTLGGAEGSGEGIAGVAFNSTIHSMKMTGFDLANQTQGFLQAAVYRSEHPDALVYNASFNVLNAFAPVADVTALCGAINSLVLSGSTPRAIVVNSAGNNNSNGLSYPGRCNAPHTGGATGTDALSAMGKPLLITVANSVSYQTNDCGNGSGGLAGIDQLCRANIAGGSPHLGSNYGSWVDIAAPGSEIRSTTIVSTGDGGGNYVSETGTTMAAPFVSGAVAILASCGVPLNEIESTLRASANVTVPFPDGSSAPRLDIYRALMSRNRAPTALALSNNSLNDLTNTSAGTQVGVLSKTDADTCDKHTYSIVGGADAASFSIGGENGDRLILTAGVLNYATKPSYAVTVRVTDNFGATFNQALTVNVASVNHAPTISNQTFRINEGSANGTAVGTVLASDPDSGNVLSYSITAGNTSNAFSINASTGALSVNNATALVYATNPVFSLTVRVTDGGGLNANATVTVNVNRAPAISNQTFSINDGTANGASVGALSASDAGDTLLYSITAGNTSSAFSINSSTGVISVSNSGALVYATNPSFSLTVRVTDSGGLTASATVTVNVNPPGAPANNAPVIANQTFMIDDGSANGTVVGAVVAGDPDTGDSLSYTIASGNTGGAFSISTSTGVLSVSNSAAVNHASNPVFGLTVQAADNGGLSATDTVTVNVNAPTISPPAPANPPASSGAGGGGCAAMPAGADPDASLILAVLVLLGYGVRRRRG